MIHEFNIMLEHQLSGEEGEERGAIDVSQTLFCYKSMLEEDLTIVNFKHGNSCTIRCRIKDYIDIWRTCTEDIKI